MAKTSSKKAKSRRPQKQQPAKPKAPQTFAPAKSLKYEAQKESRTEEKTPIPKAKTSSKNWFIRQAQTLRAKNRKFRSERVRLHKSFKRSYREEYLRKTQTPGLLNHAVSTFQVIFKNWKVFVPFIAIMVVLYIILVGLLSENLYQQFQNAISESNAQLAGNELGNFATASLLLISTITTGGFDAGMDEVGMVFMVELFLVMWLVTIFLLRHYYSGSRPKLRDALYNAMTPFISTIIIFIVIFIQAIPIMLVLITYSAAVSTNFLTTPFYALVYFIFAALMILLSMYMLSSSLMALAAVTAPGVYPVAALGSAADITAGRRTRIIIRLFYLFLVIGLVYVVIMLPIILIDLGLKSAFSWLAGWPIVPFFLLVVTCFVFIYATTYIYRYYRWLLEYDEKSTL